MEGNSNEVAHGDAVVCEIVERTVESRNVGQDPDDASGQRPTAAENSFSRDSDSQVNSAPLRPKCPYAAVRR